MSFPLCAHHNRSRAIVMPYAAPALPSSLFARRHAGAYLRCLRIAFFGCWLLFPFGRMFQTIGGISCLVLCLGYYACDYDNSVLRRLRGKWLIVFFFIFMLLNTLLSSWVRHSFSYVGSTLYLSWPMLFAGMEVTRSRRDITLLGLMFLIAACGEGLAGVWQYATGFDPINGDPPMDGRLTGSFNTYRVGNYIGIALLPACLGYFALPARWSQVRRLLITGICLLPALFLLAGSQTRSGMMGLAAGMFVILAARYSRHWPLLLILPAALTLTVLFGPERLSLELAMRDQRWELWTGAWQAFLHNPVWGTGASTFKPALNALDIVLPRGGNTFAHPHSIYVQFLVDGGVVGFTIAMGFLLGLWGWCGLRIVRGIRAYHNSAAATHWLMTAFLWGGYTCYLVTGISGHNFYRTWWLAMGVALLGATIGACLSAPAPLPAQPERTHAA